MLGCQAGLEVDGTEVLRSLELQPYDLILMDVQMPEMDGFEAARAIRKLWASADQPKIIAITAYDLRVIERSALLQVWTTTLGSP